MSQISNKRRAAGTVAAAIALGGAVAATVALFASPAEAAKISTTRLDRTTASIICRQLGGVFIEFPNGDYWCDAKTTRILCQADGNCVIGQDEERREPPTPPRDIVIPRDGLPVATVGDTADDRPSAMTTQVPRGAGSASPERAASSLPGAYATSAAGSVTRRLGHAW